MRILSGIQPTGDIHIGNYFGSINQWVNMVKDPNVEAFFMIANLHAITVPYDPQVLKEKTLFLVATYIAAGIDFKKHVIFLQSDNPDHTYTAWLFDCITPFGWMTRMTQFKDKSRKLQNQNLITTGLFNYPALMAADILLYNVDYVPVGEDQTQHVELARDIAKRFNKKFGSILKIPKIRINPVVARIMDLQKPEKKMSKSDESDAGRILILDPPEIIQKKIKRAKTDSDNLVKYDKENKPGISNLLGIFSGVTNMTIEELEKEYQGKGYAQFKQDLADAIIEYLRPIQKRIKELTKDKSELLHILDQGVARAREISSKTLSQMLDAMGFNIR